MLSLEHDRIGTDQQHNIANEFQENFFPKKKWKKKKQIETKVEVNGVQRRSQSECIRVVWKWNL